MKYLIIILSLLSLTACGDNNSNALTEEEIRQKKALAQQKSEKLAVEKIVKNELENSSKKAAIREQKLREELDALAKKQNLTIKTPPAITAAQGQKVNYTIIKKDEEGLQSKSSQVHTNADSYTNLLTTANKTDLSANDVDFGKQKIAVFAGGYRGTSGEEVKITNVTDIGSAVQVDVLYQDINITDNDICAAGAAVIYPWAMIALDTTKPIVINERHDRGCRASLTPIPYPGDERAIGYKVLHGSDVGPDVQYDANKHFKQTRGLFLNGRYKTNAYADVLKQYSTDTPKEISNKQQVLLIDRGVKNTTGYRIQIDGVTENQQQATVHITYTNPAEGCITSNTLTVPYKFVLVNSKKRIAVHERLAVDNNCGN